MRELPAEAYHIADEANMAAIARDGLLSTNALLHRGSFGSAIESQVRSHRATAVTLPDGCYVRDQRPMPPASLAACLDRGLVPGDWYDLTNDHVFFWLDRSRVARHLAALRDRPQIVLTLDARAIAARYADTAYVTPFNIGNARRAAACRGRRTLVPLRLWQEHGWVWEALPGRRPRPASHAPVELLVRGAIPDLARFILRREHAELPHFGALRAGVSAPA